MYIYYNSQNVLVGYLENIVFGNFFCRTEIVRTASNYNSTVFQTKAYKIVMNQTAMLQTNFIRVDTALRY